MPHSIDVDGIHESLFLLQNLSSASEPFCKQHKSGRNAEESGDFGWDYYFGWLKSLLCNHLIQCATKMRILQDLLSENDEEFDFAALDKDARKGLTIGRFHAGNDRLTVREACNKIIHATHVTLDWTEISKKDETEYWSGIVWLEGTKGRSEWKLELCVSEFCRALSRLLTELENRVDWYHLYTYDS
jgi:hypothetical protein